MESFRLGCFFLPDGVFSDFDDVWLRCPLTLYTVLLGYHGVKTTRMTALKKFTVLKFRKISFRMFSPVSWVFSPVSWMFPPEKTHIKFQNQNKKTANITDRAFLFTWIVHQDLIRIPQNIDKITFRLRFPFLPGKSAGWYLRKGWN